jgi:hypothetical protein
MTKIGYHSFLIWTGSIWIYVWVVATAGRSTIQTPLRIFIRDSPCKIY